MLITAPIRESDKFGSGFYGASRDGGKRIHKGIDYACYPGSLVYAHVGGIITKLGYPYGDNLGFRYVQVTDSNTNFRLRYFYVEPMVSLNQVVSAQHVIGRSQSLNDRYPGITEHVHFEITDEKGRIVDPERIRNNLARVY
jgi:murein DD-endopeptidase MepM/ murein hydrolase activator NlpD